MGRQENIAVFEDTERLCKENKKLIDSIRKSTAKQKLILEKDVLQEASLDLYEKPAKLMPEEDWFSVDVITCAAPNLREQPSNSYNSGDGRKAVKLKDSELMKLHEKRLRRILDVAVREGDEVVILGAFGCGVFLNNPETVARAARNVIPDYLHAFKTIEYAVYCSPRDDQNYKAFERVLRTFMN